MPAVPVRAEPADALAPALLAIRRQLDLPEAFPADVVRAAEAAATRGPSPVADEDRRDLPLLTIDPPGARDLDQAVAIDAAKGGFVVHYAIADVGALVDPGGPVDAEARRRGVTVYLPDGRVPLHPTVLSEGAGSLLPGEERQALLWRIALDDAGEVTGWQVGRARVRSRRALSYEDAQREIDGGSADASLRLLQEVGLRRQAAEVARGGVSLNLPEQIVEATAGGYQVHYRAPLPVEAWNAQVSLLTGMVAAASMLEDGIGILRTLPPPTEGTVATLRRQAAALGRHWPEGGYAELIRGLDPAVAEDAALLTSAARLLRGASYVAFDGEAPEGDDRRHAAVAAPYAHVTAPLRRLVDRFGSELVLAQCAGRKPEGWARDALPALPDLMHAARQREGAADRMAVDLVEAVTMSGCVGEVVEGVVTRVDSGGALVQLRHPAVVTRVAADGLTPGAEIRLRVHAADPATRTVDLRLAG